VTSGPQDQPESQATGGNARLWCSQTAATHSGVIFSLFHVLKSFLELGISEMREEQKHVLVLVFFK